MTPARTSSSGSVTVPPYVRAIALRHKLATDIDDLARAAEDLSAVIRRWIAGHGLSRAVLVVDDSPAALCALVSVIAPSGAPVHAVTTSECPNVAATLRSLGATPHVVASYLDAAEVWRAERCAVVVADIYLGDGVTGLDVIAAIGRGPRCVLITSHDGARDSVNRVAETMQAEGIVRTKTGAWEARLREGVVRLLDDAESSLGDA